MPKRQLDPRTRVYIFYCRLPQPARQKAKKWMRTFSYGDFVREWERIAPMNSQERLRELAAAEAYFTPALA